jgi:alpha-tubulin suppressor-like RCC1 family protein
MQRSLFSVRKIGAFVGAFLSLLGSGLVHAADPYAWGDGGNGQLGNGTTISSSVPVPTTTTGALLGKTVVTIAAGSFHTVARTSDGKLFAWGFNRYGQLGDGTVTDRTTPVAVVMSGALAGKSVTAIDAGEIHTVALSSDAKLFAWGRNGNGQLGDGTTTNRTTPVAVNMSGVLSGKTVTAICSGGYHTVALTSDGKVFAWGYNFYGQLGDGTTTNRTTPVAVNMNGVLAGKVVTAICAGLFHTVVRTSDGKLYAWGWNVYAQLGDGTTTDRHTAVAVNMNGALSGKNVTAISAADYHTVALTSDAKLFAWGLNSHGQLGNGTTTYNPVPGPVTMTGALSGKIVTAVSAGGWHTVARTSDGKIFAWGHNQDGEVGDGTTTDRLTPTAVVMNGALSGKSATAISAGAYYTAALAVSNPATDFNHDGRPDYLLYNASTHRTAVWYLNNNAFVSSAGGPTLPGGWKIIDVADFNRDGHPDYALFNPGTRQTAIWYLSGATVIATAAGRTAPSGWALVASADFNRDGKPDYVLYNASTHQTTIWYLNNNVYVSSAYGPTLPAGWKLVGVADFNRDGNVDYLLFYPATRASAIWYMSGVTRVAAATGPTISSGYILNGTADFNGDSKPDYVLYNPSTERTVLWYLNNNAYVSAAYGPTLPAGWSLAAP